MQKRALAMDEEEPDPIVPEKVDRLIIVPTTGGVEACMYGEPPTPEELRYVEWTEEMTDYELTDWQKVAMVNLKRRNPKRFSMKKKKKE